MQNDMHADTVFVTGATGRLGRATVKALIASGSTVKALVINKDDVKHLATGAIPFIGTLNDASVVDEACAGADTVFHFAAIVHAARSTAEEVMDANVEGTKSLLESCKKNKVKQFIFTSSIDVYGRKRQGTLTEESKPLPTDKYGYSKMIAEQEIVASGVPYTILRMANVYGPGFEHSFFKVFRAVNEGKMVIIGKGDNHMALIHVQDVVKALMLVKENPRVSVGKVYNIGDGAVYTQEGLVNTVADMLGVQRPTRHVAEVLVRMLAKSRGLDSDELRFLTSDRVIDIGRIKRELGFEPDMDIKTGGREMINEFLNKTRTK
ncbi:MAG: NAD(P)-dependent oxidoreductase [Candidatus Micrarchaeota archaeon]|nr:NAD(P)-dependent oxidoreductase [Candidatus Micrarchaeota archaeon]